MIHLKVCNQGEAAIYTAPSTPVEIIEVVAPLNVMLDKIKKYLVKDVTRAINLVEDLEQPQLLDEAKTLLKEEWKNNATAKRERLINEAKEVEKAAIKAARDAVKAAKEAAIRAITAADGEYEEKIAKIEAVSFEPEVKREVKGSYGKGAPSTPTAPAPTMTVTKDEVVDMERDIKAMGRAELFAFAQKANKQDVWKYYAEKFGALALKNKAAKKAVQQ